jgi:hypothetical protein
VRGGQGNYMIDAEFERIIKKMVKERGESIFMEPKFKSFLSDYTKNEFKKEKTLLITMIDAGCAKFISMAKNIADCKQSLVKRLEDD